MSAYNIVLGISAICPRCKAKVVTDVQFKFGSMWQYRYALGDTIRWGANNEGTPGRERVVADGASDSPCPSCGFAGDWDFYVFIEHDRIVRVSEADGSLDFVRHGRVFLDLGPGSSGGT